MAMATQEAKKIHDPYKPVDLMDWEAEKAWRAEERAQKRPLQLACLDFETAMEHEVRKPRFQYEVTCTYQRPDERGRLVKHTEKHTVKAHNETEAWAMFCDKIQTWPSPNSCERSIKQLAKVD